MVKIIDGNLLEADIDVIVQQTNCLGKMGAGLAKQIKEKYPEVYSEYKQKCFKHKPEELLGMTQFVKCHDGKIVTNLFGQLRYGRDQRHTDYIALYNALENLAKRVKESGESVGIPYELGCGLAGGNWNIVYKMINDIFGDYDKVIIYKFNK